MSLQEVSGLARETQPIEYPAGHSKAFSVVKMPGIRKYGNVTLKKSVFKADQHCWDWFNQIKMNNARFLILPWIQCKGLASKILSIVNRQLPNDWHQRYGLRPVLLETFVETERHRGTSYKAANWINVGKTVGRGKKSRVHEQIIPIKDIWLHPLRKRFRTVLCA